MIALKQSLFILIMSLAVGLAWSSSAYADRTVGIAAVVNQSAISQTDVQDRMRLILASSGLPDTPDMRKRLLPQVLDGLVEEQIKLQEAARLNIQVEDKEIDAGFKGIADQNNFTVEQFESIMNHQGIPKRTLLNQIKSQIAWSKVVQSAVRPRITVSPTDVAARIERMKSSVGKNEYLAAEIFLPVVESAREAEVKQLANKLAGEIGAQKASFSSVAAQFSKAPGAQNGGIIGWVQEGQLSPEVEKTIVELPEGAVSQPVRDLQGYHILMLQRKRTITAENIPDEETVLNQIGLERLDRAQQRYFSDLKSSAFIDRRV